MLARDRGPDSRMGNKMPCSTAAGLLRKTRSNFSHLIVVGFRHFLTGCRESDKDIETRSEAGEENDQSDELDSSDSEDGEDLPSMRSYAALMQSISAESSAPRVKRRKVDHNYEDEPPAAPEDQAHKMDMDAVDEAEEGPETAIDELLDEDDDSAENRADPFRVHYADPDEALIAKRLKCLEANEWVTQKFTLPEAARCIMSIPEKTVTNHSTPSQISDINELTLKARLAAVVSKQRPSLTDLEKTIAPIIFNYQDLLFCGRTLKNAEKLRRLSCLHVVNHIFKWAPSMCSRTSTNDLTGLEIKLSKIMLGLPEMAMMTL